MAQPIMSPGNGAHREAMKRAGISDQHLKDMDRQHDTVHRGQSVDPERKKRK